jgi:hypothetical protein
VSRIYIVAKWLAGGMPVIYGFFTAGSLSVRADLKPRMPSPKPFPEFSDLTGAEDQQSYAEDHCQFR